MFRAADALPKGSLTVAFKFRVFARRQVNAVNVIGIKSANLLSFGTTAAGNSVYFDLMNEAFDLPAPGGYASGWHQVTVSFDSATGVLQGYFDGQLGVNKTGVKQGKALAGTLGPGWLARQPILAAQSCVAFSRVPPRTDCLHESKQVASSRLRSWRKLL
jgi:hypothetical protein